MSKTTRILLVEGNDADASLIERELAHIGIACESQRAQTESELREVLRSFAPDVVLVDNALPPLSAEDALAVIRGARAHTPVLMLTEWLDGETAAKYMRAGATDYVGKHQLFYLGDAVRRALALRRAHEEALEAEAERARSEQRFRKLVEHSSDAITLLTSTGHITFSTGAVTPTLGYEIGELTGRDVFEIVHADDREHARVLLAEVLRKERAVVRSTLRVLHQDGSWRYLDVVGSNHLSDSGLDAVVVRYHDVTARYRAEAAARAMEEQRRQTRTMEAISRLATKVAHDFNNLLGAIRVSSDLALLAVDESDARVRPELLIISEATRRGERLTRQLIASARQTPASRQRVDVNAVLERMIPELSGVLEEHVLIDFEPAPSLGIVWADPAELEQVIATLAVRAGEAMPAGGTLSFEARDVDVDLSLAEAHGVSAGPYVHLAIRDTGAGMDPESTARAFEPVFSDDPAETSTRLGLAAVYRVIEGWGGFIRVDSDIDQGTTFHVFLPWQP